MSSTAFLRSSSFRWAAGGWAFFIAENVVLSENRTLLIEQLGDTGYHNVYGLCSTAAVTSIGYAYWKKVRLVEPLVAVTMPSRVVSWALLSLGLGMASQTLPKFQLPFTYGSSNESKETTVVGPRVAEPPKSSFKVQCPFDFTDPKASTGQELHGLERISRHPGLWSMGLVGLGHALLVPSLPQRVWLCMPVFVAWIGGSHTDSRYRRGMGGTLDPEYDAKTSNVPFAAMMARQDGWLDLVSEIKPLNAALAACVAAIWAFRRGGHVPAVVRKAAVDSVKK